MEISNIRLIFSDNPGIPINAMGPGLSIRKREKNFLQISCRLSVICIKIVVKSNEFQNDHYKLEYKREKYSDLVNELKEAGYNAKVFPVEVGARGFVAASTYSLMQQLSISSKSRTRTLKAMGEAAEKSSSWIWSRRNKGQLHKG